MKTPKALILFCWAAIALIAIACEDSTDQQAAPKNGQRTAETTKTTTSPVAAVTKGNGGKPYIKAVVTAEQYERNLSRAWPIASQQQAIVSCDPETKAALLVDKNDKVWYFTSDGEVSAKKTGMEYGPAINLVPKSLDRSALNIVGEALCHD